MKHVCAGWEKWNGAANIARLVAKEQKDVGFRLALATWASIRQLRSADEVWIHCGWLPCLWWAALWGRNAYWMPEACYDPVRLKYHGWKKWFVGPIERFCLRRCKALVATCKAERGWIQAYLGRRCPLIIVTDIRRFFKLPSAQVELLPKDRPVHFLYMGRRHPLKGLEFLEEAIKGVPNAELRVVSNVFGEEKDAVWQWTDVLVLPTLSDNFGLVIAEALERGKRVITTDGAPAWGPEGCGNMEILPISNPNDQLESRIWCGYGGRLMYLKGYREGSQDQRIALLKSAIQFLTTSN